MHRRIRPRGGDEIGEQAQRATAAGGLRGADARLVGARAEYEIAHQIVEADIAERTQIGLGLLLRMQPQFCLAQRRDDRRTAALVLVDADRQVDLVAPLVLAECRHDREDRIGLGGGQRLEHRHTLLLRRTARLRALLDPNWRRREGPV